MNILVSNIFDFTQISRKDIGTNMFFFKNHIFVCFNGEIEFSNNELTGSILNFNTLDGNLTGGGTSNFVLFNNSLSFYGNIATTGYFILNI